MDHVKSGHTEGGSRVSPSSGKDLFPKGWSEAQIEKAIREAYRNSRKISGFDSTGRIQKYGPGGVPRTVFVYDAMGQVAAEYSTTAKASPCVTCYLSPDHLGTTRLVTDQSGTVVARHDYLPFGEEVQGGQFGRDGNWGAGNDSVNQKFTGKERDSESGLDYFGARYYGGSLGRFTSPDAPFADQDPGNPQSWSLYSYVRNSPLINMDPSGNCTVTDGKYVEDGGDACPTSPRQTTVSDNSSYLDTLNAGLARAFHFAGQLTDLTVNFLSAPRDPGCVQKGAIVGAGLGAVIGAGAGGLGGATVGGFVGSIVPVAGTALGAAGGASLGYAGGASLGGAIGYVGGAAIGFVACYSPTGAAGGGVDGGGDGGDLRRLSPSEIRKLKAAGEDAEQIKKDIVGPGGSKYDLFKTKNGDIVIKAKNGAGEAQPTGLNIMNF